jgi:anti-sigma regulatory factor (Ser/Thr protein kinase)/serine/threonine protein phosphatase PrpC
VSQPARHIIPVLQSSDVSVARQAVRAMARALGFDEQVNEEVAIAVSELAWNLVKHARDGRLTLTALRERERAGIQIESVDSGPGIADVEQAVTDGFSTVGTLGSGLGAVNRLMDEFDITSDPQDGGSTRIICRRWKRVDTPGVISCPLEFGAATRPYPLKTVNGDAFVIEQWGESALGAVIDGVGHGEPAHQAAQTARDYVESHLDQPFKAIFSGVGRACRATQGVVMALARFDWRQARLTFASVGNVEARVFGSLNKLNFFIRRGIIGLNAPGPMVTEHHWDPNDLLVLHSDGLKAHWDWNDYAHLAKESATVIAQHLLQRLAKDDDDATVLVVKGRQGEWRGADIKP